MKKRSVVVTGVGIICAIGNNKLEVFKSMKMGKIGANKISSFSTEKLITHIGAEIKDLDLKNYFSEKEMEVMDRTAQIGIIAAKEAINDSRIESSIHNAGLVLGTCNGGITAIEKYRSIDEIPEENFLKYTFYGQTNAIARYFNLSGPINTINTACAASGNAIAFGSDMIKYGYTDIMLVGGADAMSLSVYAGFNSLKALSEEPCSPYSTKTGLTLGEGSAFLILEEYNRAMSRNAHIYAEICGYGLTNDGYHSTAPDPEGMGICNAAKMAINDAGISKDEIGYINTHGTGTAANDSAELKGLRQFFGDRIENIPISSSKAYFGHNLGAAAAIEFVSTLITLKEKYLPATMNFVAPRTGCDLKSLITNQMKRVDVIPEYFLTNNSAFGGNNCSIVVKMNNFNTLSSEEKENKKIIILGSGLLVDGKLIKDINRINFDVTVNGENEFSLKEYDSKLYTRRMNNLIQMSIAVVDSALKDANITNDVDNYEIGLCYGTAHGSLKSAEKYLGNVMEKGPEFASSIYFPDMVLNSTAGKISKALQIKGYSTSISCGGNEGLYTLLNAYHILQDGKQKYCVIAAGEEKSDFESKINKAYGIEQSNVKEGAAALILGTCNESLMDKDYVEILGFAMNSSGDEEKLIYSVLKNAGIQSDAITLVMYNSPNILSEQKCYLISNILGNQVSIENCNNEFGYIESASVINQILYAINKMQISEHRKVIVISQSVVGDLAAVVLSANK
ncbi:TPA: beta-ketoacyl-[acyl-carrier-protein] synthase family protein [Clostridioides difficile]|nr:beta-ketoacyl-[acyl-carrier-protein] synthase family protein [Clostridioides difficile]